MVINKLDNADDLETIDEEYDRGLQKKVADDPPVREGLIIDHDDNDDFLVWTTFISQKYKAQKKYWRQVENGTGFSFR